MGSGGAVAAAEVAVSVDGSSVDGEGCDVDAPFALAAFASPSSSPCGAASGSRLCAFRRNAGILRFARFFLLCRPSPADPAAPP